jgi:hypothetical protein
MTEQLPLFYKSPVPIEAERHKDWGIKKQFGFSFASNANAVPLNMVEMAEACHVYPIAFSSDAIATPVAILGLRDHENLFVNAKGEWVPDLYVPAYVRRYPFIFSEMQGNDQLTLCVDNVDLAIDTNCKQADQKFFTTDGKASPVSKNALEFCKSYHVAAKQTMEFSKAMLDNDLLVVRQAEINTPMGEKINFAGFKVIDHEKLNAISPEVFLEWREKGWLPFIYAHLFSAAQWQRLIKLYSDRVKQNAA